MGTRGGGHPKENGEELEVKADFDSASRMKPHSGTYRASFPFVAFPTSVNTSAALETLCDIHRYLGLLGISVLLVF